MSLVVYQPMISILVFVSILFNASNPALSENPPSIPLMDVSEIDALRHSEKDTLYVINFWATWCKPCIKELPYFEQVNEEYSQRPVRVILVSLDLPRTKDERVLDFVREKRIRSDVRVLENTNPNHFIPVISEEWQGNIPATLVLHPKSHIEALYPRELTYSELKSIIEPLIP